MDPRRRLRGPILLALMIGCGTASPDAGTAPLPPEAVTARDALAESLVARDPAVVSARARAAAVWEGTDRDLDLLLADALSNVLMRPADAAPILARWPASEDASYRAIVFGHALRSSDWAALGRLLPGAPVDNPVHDQLAIRARRDPGFGEEGFVRAIYACALLDREPQLGRRAVDLPVPEDVLHAMAAWGVKQMALARGSQEIDPLPERGEDPLLCRHARWLDTMELPPAAPLPLTLAVTDGTHDVYIEIGTEKTGRWSFAANDPARAGRILDAARVFSETPGDVDAKRAAMVAKYGPP